MHGHTVFLGGGLAAAAAIGAYRKAGGDDRLTLVSADVNLPYHRPPLSKGYLRGETQRDEALVEQADEYREQNVELRLSTVVEHVDLGQRALQIAGKSAIGFDRLVIATGARPRALDVPGAGLDGVFTLRTLGDADALRAAAGSARRAVVVGGSFIGTEVAASLSQLGLDVTLVHAGSRLHDRLEAPAFSRHVEKLFHAHDVRVCLESKVSAIEGSGKVERVRVEEQAIEADLVVAGVGVEPATEALSDTAIELDDGIVVDERFRTAVDGIYAIGDVARFRDTVAGRQRRIEHWDNANAQGEHLGRLLAGETDEPFAHVAMFFSDLFDLSFEVYGDLKDHDKTLECGSVDDREALLLYVRDQRLIAGLSIGQKESVTERLSELISTGARLAAEEATCAKINQQALDELFQTG